MYNIDIYVVQLKSTTVTNVDYKSALKSLLRTDFARKLHYNVYVVQINESQLTINNVSFE